MSYINTPVNVRISMGTSQGNHVEPRINIADKVSGLVIADVKISAADLTDMLAGRQVTAMTKLPESWLYEREIGKRMEIFRVPVEEWPEGWTLRDPSGPSDRGYIREETDDMKAFATVAMLTHGFQTASWTLHNYGWSLTLRRWVETTEAERIERADPHFRGL